MNDKLRLGVAITWLLAGEDAGSTARVLFVLGEYGFSDDESKEAIRVSGLGCDESFNGADSAVPEVGSGNVAA